MQLNGESPEEGADTDEDTYQGEPVSGSLALCPSGPDIERAVPDIERG